MTAPRCRRHDGRLHKLRTRRMRQAAARVHTRQTRPNVSDQAYFERIERER